MNKPSKQQVKDVMEEVEELDLPDGAHWALIHDRLGLDYGDVFDFIANDPEFFDCHPSGGDRHGE
ncbi:hypothetical protein OHI65_14765 [Brucella sp. MAB-22]|uniref:hypothetical protein n=1 Tax=Brucella sp. MAB-22 TaxID=2986424 RepID=UPI00221EFBC0|nr:hypothetical protein [Brucella sp. MAB-22]UYT57730.1 hypothetical protein OHI65_14765 [Brucella sp. MAB-22]